MGTTKHLRARVHRSTGLTRHYVGHLQGDDFVQDAELPVATWLEIQPEQDGAFLLMYLDEAFRPITDGWHSTVEDAKAQALAEFGIQGHEWFEVVLE